MKKVHSVKARDSAIQSVRPPFWQALVVMLGLVAIFTVSIIGFQLPPYLPLIMSISLVMAFGRGRGLTWTRLQNQLLKGLETGLAPLFLFLLIGMLIALWLATGVIPTMLVLGFKLANGQWFLPSALLIMALVGSMIGSAFTTLATIGTVLMGVGTTLGISPAILAGAIISGAIFGDKSSPLSDSTNLAASIAETDLFAHIKNMMWTTIPALALSLVLFTWLGLGHQGPVHPADLAVLKALFRPTWWALIPLGLLVLMAWRRIPAIPTLLVNVVISAAAFLTQRGLPALNDLLLNGYHSHSQNPLVTSLLDRGGMLAMMPTVITIMLALALGGLLTEQGLLQAVMLPLAKRIHSQAGVVTGAIFSGIVANFMIGEQYLATIIPGQLWKADFDRLHLNRLALSRTLEDSGTVFNYLVPWGVAGSFAAQTLGVSVWQFMPFVFFAWLSPIFSLIAAWTGLGLKQADH